MIVGTLPNGAAGRYFYEKDEKFPVLIAALASSSVTQEFSAREWQGSAVRLEIRLLWPSFLGNRIHAVSGLICQADDRLCRQLPVKADIGSASFGIGETTCRGFFPRG